MNRLVLTLTTGLMICAGLQAQSTILRATIPFEFRVGDKVLPAGEYIVRDTSGTLRLNRSGGGGGSVFTMTHPDGFRDLQMPPSLVFNVYGNEHYLTRVWVQDTGIGRILPKSRHEKEVAARAAQAANATVALHK